MRVPSNEFSRPQLGSAIVTPTTSNPTTVGPQSDFVCLPANTETRMLTDRIAAAMASTPAHRGTARFARLVGSSADAENRVEHFAHSLPNPAFSARTIARARFSNSSLAKMIVIELRHDLLAHAKVRGDLCVPSDHSAAK